jgi:hypothetical protein
MISNLPILAEITSYAEEPVMKPSDNKNPEFQVPVSDQEGKFLLPTSAANARKLLKNADARVQSKNPFSISLNKNVETPNTQRRLNMRSTNLHEFFKESKALYIQNVTNPIGNVSLEFRELSGMVTPVSIPSTRNPVILTDYVTFDVVKASAEFFKYLRPTSTSGAKLQLLTEEEFNSYYEKRAKDLEVGSVEEAIVESQQKVEKLMQKEKIVSEAEARAPQEGMSTLMKPEVSSRVISTCQQLDPTNPSQISAKEALDEFNNLELSSLDYDYIVNHVVVGKGNDLVRKWAVQKMQATADASGIIQTSDAPKKRTRLKQPAEA